MENCSAVFEAIGLDKKTIENTLKSKKKAADVMESIKEAGVMDGCDRVVGNLIYNVATMIPVSAVHYRPALLKLVTEGKVKTNLQVSEAIAYLKKLPAGAVLNVPELEVACGAGIEVSDEEIKQNVDALIEKNKEGLLEKRYCFPIPQLMYALKEGRMKWADGKKVKEMLDAAILALLGEKTEGDMAAMAANKKKGKKETKAAEKVETTAPETEKEKEGFEGRDLESAKNSAELIKKHLATTGGKIRCRFPPEPNGYLHIGHAKSMYLNFKGAFERVGKEGETILRFDDTNPEAEKLEFIDNIMEDVKWLGWKPCKINFASDNFDRLYEYAIQLIKMGKAYVDHQTPEEIKRSREIAQECNREGGRKDLNPESPWRNRSVEENLRLFEDMRKGKFAEGEATLRMKIDMHSPNPCMWDPVAYRIKYITHPHVGDKWCIYPSYDFQHCLVDSLEDIDYSLCTLEFEVRRESYYWLVNQLNVWRAYVWEFGRLNLTNTVMSKRKLKYMVVNHIVRGWDDPRMPTIKGLRRRGYTAKAINSFCEDISVTRTTLTTIDWSRLEHFCRESLEPEAPRAFAVLHPVRLVLVNKPDDFFTVLKAPLFPKDASKGSRELPYQKVLFVDREDVKQQDEPKFLGFAPGKVVSLKYADMVLCEEVVCDAAGEVTEVRCRVLSEEEAKDAMANKKRKMGSMHWVAGSKLGEEPARAEVRLYNHLFLEADPSELDDWVSHINKDSEIVLPGAMIEQSLVGKKVEDHVQFERLGYFVVDKDSATRSQIVYNRTCPLKSNWSVCWKRGCFGNREERSLQMWRAKRSIIDATGCATIAEIIMN